MACSIESWKLWAQGKCTVSLWTWRVLSSARNRQICPEMMVSLDEEVPASQRELMLSFLTKLSKEGGSVAVTVHVKYGLTSELAFLVMR